MKKKTVVLDKGLTLEKIAKNMACCTGPSANK